MYNQIDNNSIEKPVFEITCIAAKVLTKDEFDERRETV
jgi:hypothetical protein